MLKKKKLYLSNVMVNIILKKKNPNYKSATSKGKDIFMLQTELELKTP